MTSTAVKLTGSTRAAAQRAPLSVIPGGAVVRRAWFPILLLLSLVGGLLATLMLNTALAEGSYTRARLASESTYLADRQEVLTHELDNLRAPAALAQRALKQGMVPAQSPAFIRLSDGKVLGVAEAASADKTFKVITQPTLKKSSAASTSKKKGGSGDAADKAAGTAPKDPAPAEKD